MNTATLSPAIVETPRVGLSNPVIAQPARTNSRDNNKHNAEADLPQPGKNRRLKFKHVALVALIVLAGLCITKLTYDWWMVGRFIESTDDAYVGGDVTVIAPKVAGFISQLFVGDNQTVHAGDLLLKLDDRDYRAALDKTDAAVAIQQAALINVDATSHLQEAIVTQAQAIIASADAQITRTHDDQVRFQKLLGTGAISIQSFQQADADYKQAQADGDKARAGLSAAQRQLDVIASQKQQVQAALNAAKADRELAQLNLGYTELRAPIDGVIGNRSAQTGAYASIGSQLISLVPAHGLWIDANFKESQLAQMHPGSPVTVKIDSIPGKKFTGHVVSISPATGAQFSVLPPENATGNFTKIVQRVAVRIALDDETVQLRPGFSVTAKVDTRSNGKAGL